MPPVHVLVAGIVGYKPPVEALIEADPKAAAAAFDLLHEVVALNVNGGGGDG